MNAITGDLFAMPVRRVERLSRKSIAYMQRGDRAMCKAYWGLMVDAINRRSSAQVARMERRMGIR